MPAASRKPPFLFRHKDFGLFWGAILCANIAVQIESVTIGWQIYALARTTLSIDQSAFLVGMVGLAQFLPLMLLTLYAGSIADRHDRRLIVMLSLGVEILCIIGLTGFALQPQSNLHAIFLIAAVFGAARAFLNPPAPPSCRCWCRAPRCHRRSRSNPSAGRAR